MKLGRSSFEFKTRVWASVSCAVVASTLFSLSACGVLSSKEREETPSTLMLKAQEAYDKGNYDQAITHLNKVVEKDPSNQEARVRLAFALNASVGVSPINMLKSLTTDNASGSGSNGGTGEKSDLSKLTNGAGLPKSKTEQIKLQRALLTDVNRLREVVPEFQTFQKAFLTLCPLLSKQTLSDLRARAPSAVVLMEVDKCNDGVDVSNNNVNIAALTLAIDLFATLYNSVLDTNGDGVIDVQSDAQKASSDLSALNTNGGAGALSTLNNATEKLTLVAATLKGDVFKLATAQFNIISSVVKGSSLPSSVAGPLDKALTALDKSLNEINGYLDAGKTTSASTTSGQSAVTAANNANKKADEILKNKPEEKLTTCSKIYCMRDAYGLPKTADDMPSECKNIGYSTTCTQ